MKEFEGIDFEADLNVFYEKIRTIMAGSFEDFGPVHISENSKPRRHDWKWVKGL